MKSSFCSWDIYICFLTFWLRMLCLFWKFMTSQSGQYIVPIHILPNISRSKDNQTRTFGQLIYYSMKNIFLGKSYTKWGVEASSRLFYKKSKLSISLDQQFEILLSLILLYVQLEDYQNILKVRCWALAFSLYKAFLKTQKRPVTRLPISFFA